MALNRDELQKMLVAALPHVFGVLSLAAIVAGVWGLYGWEIGLIAAGAPPAAFYLYGQARAARGPSTGEVD